MTCSQVCWIRRGCRLDVAEARRLAQVLGLVLVDSGRVRLLLGDRQRGDDQVVQAVGGSLPAGQHHRVAGPDVLEVAPQHLVEDRVLGRKVVIQAAGEHADGVGDRPHRRRPQSLAGEHLGRGRQDQFTPILSFCHRLASPIQGGDAA